MPNSLVGGLVAFGWSDRVAAACGGLDGDPRDLARVVRVERARSIVVCTDGIERVVTSTAPSAVGDWVMARDERISVVLPRWSALGRIDPGGREVQILAANIDLVVITAPADRLNAARVERELAVAWDSGARPLVVLTKSDLAAPDAQVDLQQRLVGVEVLATSTTSGLGIDELADALRPDCTAVLLGPSGAGKSSLVNALVNAERLSTAAVRDSDRRGRHTTTSRQLVVVPSGGVLIDTPGLRGLGLAGGSIDHVFPEIDELVASCRFSDCRHEVEPGCAVLAARLSGELGADRLASFRKLSVEVGERAPRHGRSRSTGGTRRV